MCSTKRRRWKIRGRKGEMRASNKIRKADIDFKKKEKIVRVKKRFIVMQISRNGQGQDEIRKETWQNT
jgi:hypothetical protein